MESSSNQCRFVELELEQTKRALLQQKMQWVQLVEWTNENAGKSSDGADLLMGLQVK